MLLQRISGYFRYVLLRWSVHYFVWFYKYKAIFMTDVEGMQKNQGDQIVMTAYVKMVLGHLEAWFQEDNKKPLLLVGPPGCGKK